eukprot:TRINITY_DN1578_c0_g1_i1.p1 TRINITY_DN1578_c0_g1~~TRINITY_DN1578_c0_g1_i1.p1  ORF type:complete len:683 (-),score=180.78 TRINITY_DN1578_c0_g1_i1:355-2262(-)
MSHHDRPLLLPTLGQDVQLGMLYDARSSQFYAGYSLWDDKVVNAKVDIDTDKVQEAHFEYSVGTDQARDRVGLDVEGKLSLDLGLMKATGAAKYLSEKKKTANEARMDVSCTIKRHTRRIPQELLIDVQHKHHLADLRYTHFVAEVVVGGTATLTFTQTCQTEAEKNQVMGELEAVLKELPVEGSAKVDWKSKLSSISNKLNISYSGAMAENVTTMEDARRVARNMPSQLAKQENALLCKLMPLSTLPGVSTESRYPTRSLDHSMMHKTLETLRAGTDARLDLEQLMQRDLYTSFPNIRAQVSNMLAAFVPVETTFMQVARDLLPELRDGKLDLVTKSKDLLRAVELYLWHTKIVVRFLDKKDREARFFGDTIRRAESEGFQNFLGSSLSLVGSGTPQLLLSLGGSEVNKTEHPLQHYLRFNEIHAGALGAAEEYYEDDGPKRVSSGLTVLREAKDLITHARARNSASGCPPDECRGGGKMPCFAVVCGFANVDKAYNGTSSSKTDTRLGAIILNHDGKFTTVTDYLPTQPPSSPTVTAILKQNITVTWRYVADSSSPFRPLGFQIYEHCLYMGGEGATTFWPVNSSGSYEYTIPNPYNGVTVEFKVRVLTLAGPSAWSSTTTVEMPKEEGCVIS